MISLYRLSILAGLLASLFVGAAIVSADTDAELTGQLRSLQRTPNAIKELKAPTLQEKPQWYQDQLIAEQAKSIEQPAATGQPAVTKVAKYTVSVNGTTRSTLEQFASEAAQTLADSRGWSQLGISFQRVASGGDFNLILSQASLLPTYSSGCSADWSCRVGTSVIVNDDRWQGATQAWYGGGGNLRDYRHYVVNHEVGHWLGHGHYSCSGAGAKAPVMLQQSINLQGCGVNPWPLASELWTSR